MTDFAWCNVCAPPTQHTLDTILDHLQDAHDIDATPAEWPDGEVVIVDNTLTPEDFA